MTKEKVCEEFRQYIDPICDEVVFEFSDGTTKRVKYGEYLLNNVKILEQEPCSDAISRQAVLEALTKTSGIRGDVLKEALYDLPPVRPQPKTGHCKDCKYFEHDSVAKVDGIPLIGAHEICNKWGDGCKTKENGYCFLFEPQERG